MRNTVSCLAVLMLSLWGGSSPLFSQSTKDGTKVRAEERKRLRKSRTLEFSDKERRQDRKEISDETRRFVGDKAKRLGRQKGGKSRRVGRVKRGEGSDKTQASFRGEKAVQTLAPRPGKAQRRKSDLVSAVKGSHRKDRQAARFRGNRDVGVLAPPSSSKANRPGLGGRILNQYERQDWRDKQRTQGRFIGDESVHVYFQRVSKGYAGKRKHEPYRIRGRRKAKLSKAKRGRSDNTAKFMGDEQVQVEVPASSVRDKPRRLNVVKREKLKPQKQSRFRGQKDTQIRVRKASPKGHRKDRKKPNYDYDERDIWYY